MSKPAVERSETFNERLGKYGTLKQQLGPIEQQAASDPEVNSLGREVQQELVDVMSEKNPDTEEMLTKRQQLVTQIQQLQTTARPQAPAYPQDQR